VGVEWLGERIRATLDLEMLARALALTGRRYVTVKQVSGMLGVSTRTAGKIMSRLEDMGLARRYSLRAFELLPNSMPLEARKATARTPAHTSDINK